MRLEKKRSHKCWNEKDHNNIIAKNERLAKVYCRKISNNSETNWLARP